VAFLTPKALDLGDRQSRDATGGQSFADFLQFEGLDDGGDLLQNESP
jgi:hypothetical protein